MDIWPVVVAVFGLTVLGAQAKAEIDDHDVKIKQFETMVPGQVDRMARIETKIDMIQKQLDKSNK